MMALAFPETAGSDDRRIRAAFGELLEDGALRGEVREDFDLETLLEIVVGAWYSLFFSWVHFDGYPLLSRASKAARFLAQTLARSSVSDGVEVGAGKARTRQALRPTHRRPVNLEEEIQDGERS